MSLHRNLLDDIPGDLLLSAIVELRGSGVAHFNAKNNDRRTPLQVAKQNGDQNVVVMLEAAAKQHGHADRIADERKDQAPPQVGG